MNKNSFSLSTPHLLHFDDWTNTGFAHGFLDAKASEKLTETNSLLILNQIHKDTGHKVLSESDIKFVLDNKDNLDGDYWIIDSTLTYNTPLTFIIRTADCVPLIVKAGDYFGLIHAGWKGLACGVIEVCVRELAKLACPEAALIGPSANECCYQVGSEVIEAIGKPVVFSQTKDGIYLSSSKTAKNILKTCDITDIHNVEICTICSPEYYSYRNGDLEARNFTFLTLGMS